MKSAIWLTAAALVLPITVQAEDAMSGKETSKATQFTVRIQNVSTPSTLKGMNGKTAPAPNSPGMWVIQTLPARIFEAGKLEMGWGLEAQAEWGDPSKLAEHCMSHEGVVASGVFNTPIGNQKPGPATPGKAYEFTVAARPGERLSFTTMFAQSNDLFFSPEADGIALFDSYDRPKGGDVTAQLALWDAGTEVNEEPGFGPNQGPRQSGMNVGPSEKRPVNKVKDAFKYPKVTDVLKVTITPMEATAGR